MLGAICGVVVSIAVTALTGVPLSKATAFTTGALVGDALEEGQLPEASINQFMAGTGLGLLGVTAIGGTVPEIVEGSFAAAGLLAQAVQQHNADDGDGSPGSA
jgi:hypothetical protein